MRIALTHNLRLSESEEEAEFDTRETVDALAAGLERLGHRVERIEVSGPASRTVTRLEAFGPDLIFNTAEGRRGRFREAFFPALFDELGMPYTGSDAYALAVTLDKGLTKLVLSQHGVATPRWQYVERPPCSSRSSSSAATSPCRSWRRRRRTAAACSSRSST
jgi:D-alanine-D-alanine ligase